MKGSTKYDILQALERRLANAPDGNARRRCARSIASRSFDCTTRFNSMEQFASGWKRNYYGKGDVIVYRLHRDGMAPAGQSPVFGANVKMLIYGDAFWPTYTTGDNTGLIATDSMKNFIQRETLNFTGRRSGIVLPVSGREVSGDLSAGGRLAGLGHRRFPTAAIAGWQCGLCARGPGPRHRPHRTESRRARSSSPRGIRGFKLLRLGGSAFHGFVRDQYTTLPDIHNRPLHMWLDLDWRYTDPPPDSARAPSRRRCAAWCTRFSTRSNRAASSRSSTRSARACWRRFRQSRRCDLEANNRTWDTVAERGDDARRVHRCAAALRLSRP